MTRCPSTRSIGMLTALLCLGFAGLAVHAQDAGGGAGAPVFAEGDRIPVTIRALGEEYEAIVVPVGRSKLVEFPEGVLIKSLQDMADGKLVTLSVTKGGRAFVIAGREPGQTQILAELQNGDRPIGFDVFVDPDLERLRAAIRQVAPQAQVDVQLILSFLVVSGRVPDLLTAERIVELAEGFAPGKVKNHLDVGGLQQVMVRVTFAEVQRQAIRQLGVNWLTWDNDFFFGNNLGGINPTSIGLPAGTPITANTSDRKLGIGRGGAIIDPARGGFVPYELQSGTGVTGNATVYFGIPSWQINAYIVALRENNLLRVLAEPTLVAMSGKEASFLAGGEFPFAVPNAAAGGATTFTIEFKEFGVRLSFKPTVLGGQNIRMDIRPEVSDLDFANSVSLGASVVPGLIVRRVETTVELGNGQTLAIAGLLNNRIAANDQRVPFLGDVPVLGQLFASRRYQKNETELLVLITPELVDPLNPDDVRTVPGQFMTEPNDWQLFGLGMLEGEPKTPGVPEGTSGPDKPRLPLLDAPPAGDGSVRATSPISAQARADAAGSAVTGRGPWGMGYGEDAPRE